MKPFAFAALAGLAFFNSVASANLISKLPQQAHAVS